MCVLEAGTGEREDGGKNFQSISEWKDSKGKMKPASKLGFALRIFMNRKF